MHHPNNIGDRCFLPKDKHYFNAPNSSLELICIPGHFLPHGYTAGNVFDWISRADIAWKAGATNIVDVFRHLILEPAQPMI